MACRLTAPIRALRRSAWASLLLTALLQATRPDAAAAAIDPAPQDLKRMSIEDLMRIDVTSVNRREEPVGTAAAAMSVITSDDLRRSGVTTIPDALALADGVHVARSNNGTWAISARGFNQSTSNKLLVMIDGRTMYSPLFTGVFWNAIDYVLEDIDRIEVIRGPGATLWGANAVNGVINIITKPSTRTRGAYASISAGNEDRATAEVRYGGGSQATAWRVYAKFADRDDQRLASGEPAQDARRRGQVGVRVDGGAPDALSWTLKADAFHSADAFLNRPAGEFTDLGLQGRWSTPAFGASRVDVQTYYRREYRRSPSQLTHSVDVVDVDAQQSATWAQRHGLVWGGGMRANRDRTLGTSTLRFDPARRRYSVASVFVQDEIAVVPDRLFATVGAKWEHNTFSGGHLQPNLRARLLLPRTQMVWGAVSHAVRRPSRLEDDVVITAANGRVTVGSDDVRAESLVATEAGYRVRPSGAVSLDATVFRHRFTDLRSVEAPLHSGDPFTLGNSLTGRSHGLELAANLQPAGGWRTHVGYTWLRTAVRAVSGSRDTSGGVSEANDPRHLLTLRSALDLGSRIEVDGLVRMVSELANPRVPGYVEFGMRAGWQLTPAAQLFVAGQDLRNDRHPEFGPNLPNRTEFERSVRVGLTLRR